MSSLHTPAAIRRILSLQTQAPPIRRSLSLRTPAPIRRSLSLHAQHPAPPFRGSLSLHAPAALPGPTTISDETGGSDPGEAKDGVYEKEKKNDASKNDGERGKKDGDGEGKSGGAGRRFRKGRKEEQIDNLKLEISYHLKLERSGAQGNEENEAKPKKKDPEKWEWDMSKIYQGLNCVIVSVLFVFVCTTFHKPDGDKKLANIIKVMSSCGELVQKANVIQKQTSTETK